MLPGLEGIEVCRSLKQNEKTRRIPVIMLTVKNSDADKVLGLEMGADDYVTKPFSPRNSWRASKPFCVGSIPRPRRIFRSRGLEIDWARHQVVVSGQAVELTPKEFELLKALIEANGKVLSRERLLDRVWVLTAPAILIQSEIAFFRSTAIGSLIAKNSTQPDFR